MSDKGYGISYMVPDDTQLFFHVSSKISSENTQSERMMENIFESLSQMKAVVEEAKKS